MTIADCLAWLETSAPPALAEPWDNVGLLVGDRAASVSRVLTCLTVTPDVVEEAVAERVQLIVAHHPVLFRPVQRLTTDTPGGTLLLRLITAGIAVYSAHTAYDSAPAGINQQIAESLGLLNIQALRAIGGGASPTAASEQSTSLAPASGGGRHGTLPRPMLLCELISRVRDVLCAKGVQYVGDPQRSVTRIAIACGSAGEFLPDATRAGCDVLVTGETRFHTCLEARTSGIALVLAGHYATERPAVETLARKLGEHFPSLSVWASRVECDPVQWSAS